MNWGRGPLSHAVDDHRLCYRPLMNEFIRALRIVAGLMLIGAGLGLIGALIHTESATHGPVVAKAGHDFHATVPAGTALPKNSRHS
jgi:hypothetical protein